MSFTQKKFNNTVLFKDPIYGIHGKFFFPGTAEDLNRWVELILKRIKKIFKRINKIIIYGKFKQKITLNLLKQLSPKKLLKQKEKLNGIQSLRDVDYDPDLMPSDDEFKEATDWFLGINDYFDERFRPIADWDSFNFLMSVFYKEICYCHDPFLGVICDFESNSFDLSNDSRLVDPKFRQDIIKFYLLDNLEKSFCLSGNLHILESAEKNENDCAIGVRWFSYISDFFLYSRVEKEKIKKEMLALFERNPWILVDLEVKESFKKGFIKKIKSFSRAKFREMPIKIRCPLGFKEILFFFLKLFFPEAPILEYDFAFENSTVDQFLKKLKCL